MDTGKLEIAKHHLKRKSSGLKTEGPVKKMIEILFGTYEGLAMMEAKNYEAPDFRHCASSIGYIGRFPKFRAIGYIGRFLICVQDMAGTMLIWKIGMRNGISA